MGTKKLTKDFDLLVRNTNIASTADSRTCQCQGGE